MGQYVDYENKRVLVKDLKTTEETYLPYDLLIGCDGIRSTVREALVKRHSDFSCNITDIFHSAAKELKSDDYKVVSKYMKENFKPFQLVDYDDFAKQWVGQRWNQTSMVHCNFYHSVQTGIVIMGDAAHATSPSIGMGMNTALRDAQIFHEVLKAHKDDLDKALPAFSKERVKEGNSLSDLAMHLYCLDRNQQLKETLHLVIRSMLNTMFPSFVNEHAQVMIGRRGVSLSDAYQTAVEQGIIRKQRDINDRIRMDYFEHETGMLEDSPKKNRNGRIIFGAALLTLSAVSFQKIFN